MLGKLSSIRITFITLTTLFLLLMAGIAMSSLFGCKETFAAMNQTIVLAWLKNNWQENSAVTLWLLTITATALVLLANIVCCTFGKQLKTAVRATTIQRWLFFFLHILFLIVLVCHGISMVTGHKTTSIVLYKGDELLFNEQYRIAVKALNFADDPALLQMDPRKSRKMMTRDRFHIKENHAVISIGEKTKKPVTRKATMLHPVSYGGARVTITGFTARGTSKDIEAGIDVTISKDIFTHFFFTVYALMIVAMAGFTAVTWHNGPKEKSHEPQKNH